MTSLAPVLTIVLSLAIYHVVPHPVLVVGMVLACMTLPCGRFALSGPDFW
jgi:hypothetical protein